MDAPTITTLRCTGCGALADAKCACGLSYEPLSRTQRMERRRDKATELYKAGLTMEQIADKLKVSRRTVGEDLGDLGESPKSKTATNPKGAGRPKKVRQPKPPGVKQAQRSIDLDADTWEQVKARAATANMPAAKFIGALLTATINPEIDLTTLSKTAQNKVSAAIRQHQKKLDREFESLVQGEVKTRMATANASTTAARNEAFKQEKFYREFMAKQKKIMTVAEFTLVCSLLHPDSRISASEERLRRAFQMFEPKKFALTGEK